jgi:hypothetical protein
VAKTSDRRLRREVRRASNATAATIAGAAVGSGTAMNVTSIAVEE